MLPVIHFPWLLAVVQRRVAVVAILAAVCVEFLILT